MHKLILFGLVSCAFAAPVIANPHGGGQGNGGMNHGGAVSAEAHLARSQHGGGIGQDVSAVARDKSRFGVHGRSRHGNAFAFGHSHIHKHNHGGAVSAEAHLARSQHGGGIGKDVRAVAHDKTHK
jgi:hypothetical protein